MRRIAIIGLAAGVIVVVAGVVIWRRSAGSPREHHVAVTVTQHEGEAAQAFEDRLLREGIDACGQQGRRVVVRLTVYARYLDGQVRETHRNCYTYP